MNKNINKEIFLEATAGMRGEIMVDRARMGEAEVKAESKGNF